MQSRFHGPQRDLQQSRDLFLRKFPEEEESQHFALQHRQAVERLVDFVGVVELGDPIVAPGVAG